MTEFSTWEESKGRIADRLDLHTADLKAIKDNTSRLVWIGITAFLTLLGHAVMSYIQMGSPQ